MADPATYLPQKGSLMSDDAIRSTDLTTGGSTDITTDGRTAQEDGLTAQELEAEGITPLPDKEVVSILDLNVDLDLAVDLAAPIDLAVAANANVAAPIDAAVGANVLSVGSTAQALADQGVMITQDIVGDSSASAMQVSEIDQSDDAVGAGAPVTTDPTTGTGDAVDDGASGAIADVGDTISGVDTTDALSGPVLSVNVDAAADLDLTAPIAGAVAANANVAAPIDAAAAANVASIASNAVAVANQDAIIDQSIEGDATATADQDSEITQ
jgi:hypothetical protein